MPVTRQNSSTHQRFSGNNHILSCALLQIGVNGLGAGQAYAGGSPLSATGRFFDMAGRRAGNERSSGPSAARITMKDGRMPTQRKPKLETLFRTSVAPNFVDMSRSSGLSE